ncbi:hypothetical protein [Isoptericola sp. NPDC055881]
MDVTEQTQTPELEPQEPAEDVTPDETPQAPTEPQDDAQEPEDDAETFPREYVVKLRKEAADARVKVKDRDALAGRLHDALVAATGRLADPSDLPFNEAHLDDPEALERAISDLLSRKPHLASRRVTGDVGQGASGDAGGVSLAGLLRAGAN